MQTRLLLSVLTLGLAGACSPIARAQPLSFSTLAGSGSTGSTDAAGTNASFYWPRGAVADNSGNVYVTDTQNGTIRKVAASGSVSTLAGSPGILGSADGTGTSASFNGPQGVAIGPDNHLYVADGGNHTIRRITAAGSVTTLAGAAGVNGSADGIGTNAQFFGPQDVAVDRAGNVFVADTCNHTIRKITPAGSVSTFAGLAGAYGGSDGPAANVGTNCARFYYPAGIAVDVWGAIYVGDSFNHTIRKVTPAGVVTTLAGLPGLWGSTDGTNGTARFYRPTGLAVDIATNIYVLDSGNNTIRRLSPQGTNWVVSTVGGAAGLPGSTNGTGSSARFTHPSGLALDAASTLYVADTANNLVRQGVLIGTGVPVVLTQPQNQTVGLDASAMFGVIAGGAPPLTYQWTLYATNIPGATNAILNREHVTLDDAGTYAVVVSNALGSATSSNALLTVLAAPSIVTHPLSQSVLQGQNAAFTVTASGTPPLYAQWTFNGSAIAGATGTSYTRPQVQLADAGTYAVTLTNLVGAATSSNAVLTVVAAATILTNPQPQVANPGNRVTFSVIASGTPPLTYQWRRYGTNLSAATGSSLLLTSVSATDSGPYTAVVTNLYGATTSSVATLQVKAAFEAGGLAPLWKLAPGSRPYLTVSSLPNERGMAYNPATDHLLVVSRTAPSVYVLDASTGADLNQLNVAGIAGGTYTLLMVGAADDGVVYAGNLTTASATTAFTLYRWANDSAAAVPTVAYTGNPTSGNSQRYGDTLEVRGAGTSTQIIIGSRSSTNAIVFTTSDGLSFTPHNVVVADAVAGSFGLGLTFGGGNTFWGKSTALPLRQVSYNLASGTAGTASLYADPTIPNSVGPIAMSSPLNVLAGINVGTTNNHLRLYDLAPTLTNGAPRLFATNTFATDNDNSGTGTGAVDFGGTTVYALGANNGLMAVQIVPAQTLVPQAAQFQRISRLTGGSMQLEMTGTPSASYDLDFTGNWLNWSNLATLSGSNGLFQYVDDGATNSPRRFYRLKSQ